MNEEWKVHVNNEPWSDNTVVWLGRYKDGRFYNATIAKDGYLQLDEQKEGAVPPPLMKLPTPVWKQLIDAVNKVVPPIEKEIVDAELKATRYHLEDMRTLVFKRSMK